MTVDLGTLTDEYEKEISIHTTATSKDGEKTILAGKEVTIVDTVKLDGLTKGTKISAQRLADVKGRKHRASYQWKACGK